MTSALHEISAPRTDRKTSQEETSLHLPQPFWGISNRDACLNFSGFHSRLKLILILQWEVPPIFFLAAAQFFFDHYLKIDQATSRFRGFAQLIIQKYSHTFFLIHVSIKVTWKIISRIFFVVAVQELYTHIQNGGSSWVISSSLHFWVYKSPPTPRLLLINIQGREKERRGGGLETSTENYLHHRKCLRPLPRQPASSILTTTLNADRLPFVP